MTGGNPAGAERVAPEHGPGGGVRAVVRRPDGSLAVGGAELASGPSARWIVIEAPTPEQLRWLGDTFGFHPLALEDCAHRDQRPKAEEYADHVFVVVHQLTPGRAPEKLSVREVHNFLGPDYLVTVIADPVPAVDAVFARASTEPAVLERGPDFALYQVCDAVVDAHFHVVDALGDAIDAVEDGILRGGRRGELARIVALKRALVLLRRILSPTRDVMAMLARRGHACIAERTTFYFRDVYDHLVRVSEAIDSCRDLLGNALDAHLAIAANRTSDITKQLTLLASIFLPLSFGAGFFGMNFEARVMLTAYPGVFYGLVGAMALLPVAMLAWFRHKGWL